MAMDKNSQEFIQFCHSIMQSVPFGIVGFGGDLKIIENNQKAGELIEISEYIDKSLAFGTDSKIWADWGGELKASLESGQSWNAICRRDNGVPALSSR